MSSSDTNIRQFEGIIHIKGFKIGYVLWIPVNEKSIGYDSMNIAIDPLSMTSHFDETILCFHGWLDNANSFAMLSPLLCSKFNNMRVISFDLPGHGKSSHSLLGYYDITMMLTAMLRIINKIHINAFHIFAHSLSAVYIPYLVPVLEHSKRFNVKSVICIEAFGRHKFGSSIKLKPVKLESLLPAKTNDIDEDIDIKQLPKLYNSLDELVTSRIYVIEKRYPGKQTIGKETARLILKRNVGKIIVVESKTRKKQIKYYLRFDQILKQMHFSNTLEHVLPLSLQMMETDVIGKIQCPLFVVYGDNGYPMSYNIANQRVKRLNIKNINIIRIKGSHHLHSDDPVLFLEKITPFLINAINKYKKEHPNRNGNGNNHSKL